ncbi:MAG: hypothetical protein NZ736_00285 [Candidatus Poseidoniaceae archaeon]|nr:hypothetical protein [Candidatus Poseidoniaceae archaeon]
MNRMRSRTIIVILLLMILPITITSSAQFGSQSWELGWVTNVDGNYEVEMEDDWDISGELVIFIENSRQNELNVNFDLEWDSDIPFIVDGPESGTVAGGENLSFTFTLTEDSTLDIRSFSPSDTYVLTLTADEVVSDQTVSSQDLDAGVKLPKIFNLQPDDIPDQSMHSDTWIEVEILVSNWGNNRDAVTSADVDIRSCPNLKAEGLEQFDNLVVEPTDLNNNVAKGFEVKFVASVSHPDRTCEVTFSVISEGDERVRSTTFDLKVSAAEVVVDDNSGDGGSSDGDGLSENTSNLAWYGFYELLFTLLFAAYISRR